MDRKPVLAHEVQATALLRVYTAPDTQTSAHVWLSAPAEWLELDVRAEFTLAPDREIPATLH